MLDLGRVVATHPESNSVDLQMLASGARLSGVQVMGGAAGASHGFHDLPRPREQELAPTDPFSAVHQAGDARATLAVVAYYRAIPVVMGFLYPQVSQCLFADRDRMIYRHASDLYATVDGSANFEVHHPSGVSLRIAETPDHEDLTGRDFDGKWRLDRNTGRAVHVQLTMPNAIVHLDPAGNVSVEHAGDLEVSTGGNASVSVSGDAAVDVGGTTTLNSAGDVLVEAPEVTVDAADVIVTGKLTVQGGMAVTGGSGTSAEINGNVTVVGQLMNNGKLVGSTHRHTSSSSGSPTSTPL